MKKYFLLLAGVVLLGSCNTKPDPAKTSYIQGQVQSVYQDYIAFTIGEYLDSAKIDRDGKFNLEVPVSEKGSGILMYNNRLLEIWLEPAKTLSLVIVGPSFPNEVQYDNELGPINYYMELTRKLENRSEKTTQALYGMELSEFEGFIDSIRLQKEQLLEEYKSRYPDFDSSFAHQEKTEILYTWGMQKMQYPGYHTLIKKQDS